jgi:hypothetical protein
VRTTIAIPGGQSDTADFAASAASGDGQDTAQGEVVITGSAAAAGTSLAGSDAEDGATVTGVVGVVDVIGVVEVDDPLQPDIRTMAVTASRLTTHSNPSCDRSLESTLRIPSST